MSKAGAHLHPTDAHARTHPPPCHRIPSALLPSPSTLPFFLSFSSPSSPSVRGGGGGGGRSSAFVAREGQRREGKVRPSPLLCLPLSFLSSVAPPPIHPSLPPYLLPLPPAPSPPRVFAFDIQRWVWSGVERSEERRGRNSRTTVNFRPFNSVNPSAISRLLARTWSHSVLPVITPALHCSSAWHQQRRQKIVCDSLRHIHLPSSWKVCTFGHP